MSNFLRVFGSGPIGVLLSLGLVLLGSWCQAHYPSASLGLTPSTRYVVLLVSGVCCLAGIVWSFRSLPVSQRGRGLCTQGAYRWVRHPLYASFITLGAPGVAVFLNHWRGLLWVVVLHLVWHVAIAVEEKNMVALFGDEYVAYARRTGRFVPRLWRSAGEPMTLALVLIAVTASLGLRPAADQASAPPRSGANGASQALAAGWSHMDSGTKNNLIGLWGQSPTDVFAVGPKGTILHFDGRTWSPMTVEGSPHLLAVWGSSNRDVFAVGDAGVIVHYDGQAWTPMTSGTRENLISVWGTSRRDVFAAGYAGTVLHYDGVRWTPMPTGTTEDLYGVWGTASNHVLAVGGTPMPLPGKGLVLRFDGKSWSRMKIPDSPFLAGVWGSSRNDAFAVGVNLAILRFDGEVWSVMAADAPLAPGKPNLLARVWGRGPNDVYAAGFDGVVLHYDGRAWSPVPLGTSKRVGVFGVGPSDVFIVGSGGLILHHRPR